MLFVLFAAILFVVWLCAPRGHVCFKHLPTLPRLPLIGHAYLFVGGGQMAFRRLQQVSEISEESGLPVFLMMASYPAIVISDPAEAKIISNSFLDKPQFVEFAKEWVKDGLITASGTIWKAHIKKLGRSFSSSVVAEYQAVFNQQASRIVHRLKQRAGEGYFDPLHDISAVALDTIYQTGMGMDPTADKIQLREYCQAVNKILQLVTERGMNIFCYPEWVYRLTTSCRQYRGLVRVVKQHSDEIIKTRLSERKTEGMENKAESGNGLRPNTFLDYLLELNEKGPIFSPAQVSNEVDTIIAAGYKTVTYAVFYTLLMLARHCDVQQKLFAEIKDIIGSEKRDVEKQELDRMEYCEVVVAETLRLLPPVPVYFRQADRQIQMKSCSVASGTTCVVNVWGMGRSRRVWGEDAGSFRPERWRGAAPARAAAPFGLGRRDCVGKKYAMAFVKTAVVHCVRDLVFESQGEDMELKFEIILKPVRGHLLQVHLRR